MNHPFEELENQESFSQPHQGKNHHILGTRPIPQACEVLFHGSRLSDAIRKSQCYAAVSRCSARSGNGKKLPDKLRKMTDEELIRFGKEVRRLAENPFQRQLEEARREWKQRKGLRKWQ